MIISLGLVFLAVLFTAISQVFLKIGAQSGGPIRGFFTIYLNFYTLSAYAILLLVTIISVIALIEVPLKLFYTIASLNFVIVVLLSWIVLKEEMNRGIISGIIIIVMGVMIFNL